MTLKKIKILIGIGKKLKHCHDRLIKEDGKKSMRYCK